MACRNVKTLLSANQSDVWNDMSVRIAPDIISATDHQIATIRRVRRKKIAEHESTFAPGETLSFDIIKNVSESSITPASHFPYILLVVDLVSRRPYLVGLNRVNADTIIDKFKSLAAQHFSAVRNKEEKMNIENSPISRFYGDYGSVFPSAKFRELCVLF